VQRFVRQPIRNPIGKKWQEAAIEMKKRWVYQNKDFS
jgi:hypothetical protein